MREEVLKIALPATGEQLLSMMVSIVDTVLVGHLGATALAAVSLGAQWSFLAITLFSAVATGAMAVIARSVGANDWKTANRSLRQSLLIGLVLGSVATVLFLLLSRPMIMLMGAEPDVLREGVTYLRISSSIFIFSALMFVGNACLRSVGDTRVTMVIMAVVNITNIIITWVTINGLLGLPKMGVAGSALGTAIGRAIGGVLVIALLIKGRSGLKLQLQDLRYDAQLAGRIIKVGIPTAIESGSMRLGLMLFLRVVSGLGTLAIAAHSIALRAESLSFLPGYGFAVAGTTLVGQNLGAKNPKRAQRSGYLAFIIAGTIMMLMGVVFVLAPHFVIGFFTNDQEIIRAAALPLRIIGFVQPMLAAAMVFPGSLRGAGDTRFPMLITTLGVWGIRVPAAFLLISVLGLGLPAAWCGMAADLTMRAIVTSLRFRKGQWKHLEV